MRLLVTRNNCNLFPLRSFSGVLLHSACSRRVVASAKDALKHSVQACATQPSGSQQVLIRQQTAGAQAAYLHLPFCKRKCFYCESWADFTPSPAVAKSSSVHMTGNWHGPLQMVEQQATAESCGRLSTADITSVAAQATSQCCQSARGWSSQQSATAWAIT